MEKKRGGEGRGRREETDQEGVRLIQPLLLWGGREGATFADPGRFVVVGRKLGGTWETRVFDTFGACRGATAHAVKYPL